MLEEIKYGSIESMHPDIRAFFEARGRLELDDPKTPTMILLHPKDSKPGRYIAMSVHECSWLFHFDQYYIDLRKGRRAIDWLYWGADKWVSEEDMLKLIKLVVFW